MTVRTRNARILPFRANWGDGVVSEYTFRTDIFTSRDGTEQRVARRQTARQATEITGVLRQGATARLEADMAFGLAEPVFVRAEWLQAVTSAVTASGASVLTFEATPSWIVVGAKIIATTPTHEDLLTVSGVTATTVTVEEAASVEYAVGTRVHKALETRFPESVNPDALTETVRQPRIRFEAIPGTQVETFDSTPFDTFEGRELFLRKPNWRDSVTLEFAEARDEFDPGLGRDEVAPYERAVKLGVQCGFSGMNFAGAQELVDFWLRMRGRRNAFWSPIWSRSVIPSDTDTGVANTFQVDGPDFTPAYDGNPIYRAMIAFWPDGSFQANRLTSVAGASNAVLTFADAWVNPVVTTTRIFWLAYSRFNSDVLSVQWLTDARCEITLPIKTLYAPEAP